MTLVEPIEKWTDRPLPWALMLPFAYTTVEPRRSKIARIGTKTRLLRMTGGWSNAMTCPLTTTVTLAAKIGPIVAAAAIAAAAAKPAGRLNLCIPYLPPRNDSEGNAYPSAGRVFARLLR